MIPLTPNNNSQLNTSHSRSMSFNDVESLAHDETTRLHEQYKTLVDKNQE